MIRQPAIKSDNYDSVIHAATPGQPATMTIRLKLRLIARDPAAQPPPGSARRTPVWVEFLAPTPSAAAARTGIVFDANGKPFRCRGWEQAEFNAFKIRFKRVVETAWNNQLILLPPEPGPESGGLSDAAWRDFISSPGVPAHVRCGLEIELLDGSLAATPHSRMEVARLAAPANQQFRSRSLRISNEDLDVKIRERDGATYRQFTAAHEVGHRLRSPAEDFLEHVEAEEAEADGATDKHAPYGRVAGKRMAMMGIGSLVTRYDAIPWLRRIVTHTGSLFEWDYAHRVQLERRQLPVSPRQNALVNGTVSGHP